MARKLLRRRRKQISFDAFEIREEYSSRNGEAQAEADFLWTSLEGTGRSQTIVTDVDFQLNGRGPGFALIFLTRRTATTQEFLRRFPDRAVLFTKTSSRLRRANATEDGSIIQGLDPADPTGRTKWQLVKGEGVIPQESAVFVVRGFTRRPKTFITQFQELINSINTNRMSDVFGKYRDPRKLRLAGVDSRPDTFTSKGFWVDYYLEGRAQGWAKETSNKRPFQILPTVLGEPTTQFLGLTLPDPTEWMFTSLRMEKISQKVKSRDIDGNDSTETKDTVIWQPFRELLKAKTDTKPAEFGPLQWRSGPEFFGASFARIDKMIL